MKRIILHWTAGTHKVTDIDRKHYHYIVDGLGTIHPGDHPISANDSTADGDYAAHTKGCNRESIGLAIACMADAKQGKEEQCKWPPTKPQVNELCKLAARLSKVYAIPNSPTTILCHSEVQKNLKIAQRGKWDIEWLPWDILPHKRAGDWLRALIEEYRKGVIL